MSKFSNIFHLLDLKNFEIKDREFPNNVKPFFKQQVCVIPIKLPKLNPLCEKCRFHDVITTQGKVDELGVDGYMTNQADPIEPVKHNPSRGVSLRDPRAIIMASGQVFICRNPKQINPSYFFLTEKEPACSLFDKKTELEYKKLKGE
jgi:hypothetical protein